MTQDLTRGQLIAHRNKPEWGPGKIVARDGGDVLVYFRDLSAAKPDDRVKRFAAALPLLELLQNQTDEFLDRLPPYVNGKFSVLKTSLTLEAARQRFLTFAPRGFADPRYWQEERDYKWSAHLRCQDLLAPHVEAWVAQRDADSIRKALVEVYWPTKERGHKLNLLSPRFEWPAFKDSLEQDTPFIEYVAAGFAFATDPQADDAGFDRYSEAVANLPTRKGGNSLEKWTVLTWLPFIIDPTHHIFLKPQMTQEFASILPFDLQYRAELNSTTYRRLQEMANLLRVRIDDPETNPECRGLDMIDLHSFMWLVTENDKYV